MNVPANGVRGGPVVVRLLQKAIAMDAALELAAGGDLLPQDLAVLWFLCSNLDRESGECTRRYQTIAKGCGVSRSTAVRAIARLKDLGLIEIRERLFTERRGKLATAFRLGAREKGAGSAPFSGAEIGAQVNLGSVHTCTGKVSHVIHIPNGGPPDQEGPAFDWDDALDWLTEQGDYKGFGHGYGQLARADLMRWREEFGDRVLMRAVTKARECGLHGARLVDFMERTWPGREGGAKNSEASRRDQGPRHSDIFFGRANSRPSKHQAVGGSARKISGLG